MEIYFNNDEFKDEIELILKKLKDEIYVGGIYLLKSLFKQKKRLKKSFIKNQTYGRKC